MSVPDASRHVDPAVVSHASTLPAPLVACLHLPQHLSARLDASSRGYTALPCLHSAADADTHGSGVEPAAAITDSLTLRLNALTSLLPTPAPLSTQSSGPAALPLSRAPESPALAVFQRLLAIDLNHNRLRCLDGIEVLPQLMSVRVAHNELVSLSALWRAPCMARLDVLDVTGNRLESLLSAAENGDDVAHLRAVSPPLRVLYAADNRITSVDDVFISFPKLQDARLRRNQLHDLSTRTVSPEHAPHPSRLRYLDVAENPLSSRTCADWKAHKPEELVLVMSSPVSTPRAPSPGPQTPGPSSCPRVVRRSVKKAPPAASGGSTERVAPSAVEAADAAPARRSASPSRTPSAPADVASPAAAPHTSCASGETAQGSREGCDGGAPRLAVTSNDAAASPVPGGDEDETRPPVDSHKPPTAAREQFQTALEARAPRPVSLPLPPAAEEVDATEAAHPDGSAVGGPHTGPLTATGVPPPVSSGSVSASPSVLAVSPDVPPLNSEAASAAGDGGIGDPARTVDPRAALRSVAENTYVIDVQMAFDTFAHNVQLALLQTAARTAGANSADVLSDPVVTATALRRLPTMDLVFQTEVYMIPPTLVLANITPACARPTVMQKLFVGYLLRSLKMEEEVARTRLLRSRVVTESGPVDVGGSRSRQEKRAGAVSDVVSHPPDEGPRIVEFGNAGEGAPALRLYHVFSSPPSSSAATTTVDPLFYLRWRREWEVAVSRRKLALGPHYLLDPTIPEKDMPLTEPRVAVPLPTGAPWLAQCRAVPQAWTRLYKSLVLDLGDGAASVGRSSRARGTGRRSAVDSRDGLSRAVYRLLSDAESAHGDAKAPLSVENVPARGRRLATPVAMPALQKPALDAAQPVSGLHTVRPQWRRSLVESYATLRAPTLSGAGTGASAATTTAGRGFDRTASVMSSGRTFGTRSRAVTPPDAAMAARSSSGGGRGGVPQPVSVPAPLASQNFVTQACSLRKTLDALMAMRQARVAQHAAAQVRDGPLPVFDTEAIERNRVARAAVWRTCQQQATRVLHTEAASANVESAVDEGVNVGGGLQADTGAAEHLDVVDRQEEPGDGGDCDIPVARHLNDFACEHLCSLTP